MSPSRRSFLGGAAALAATPGIARAAPLPADAEAFFGPHQGGIATRQQNQIYFAAFDLVATSRAEVIALLRAWTEAAARLTRGLPAQAMEQTFHPVPGASAEAGYGAEEARETPDPATMAPDSGEALGMGPSRLTLTFGFGAGLFEKDGKDRYGLAKARPAALVDLPRFVGDQMAKGATDGDLAIQACADDPQVAFHAIRQLARIGDAVVRLRWVQAGFNPPTPPGQTPRNLMGFKDGTNNVAAGDEASMARHVWVGTEGPGWMQGGSYLVARRIRIALEHWDRMRVAFQEQTFGRHKISGAPLGERHEHAPLPLAAKDRDGNPVIAENAHVRLAAPESNGGAQILRRSYAFNDGAAFTAERWPPWRQGMEYEAGLFFVAFQRDPRTGFIRIFERMAKFDMMNQFTTHVGSGLFACPGGAKPGEFIGQALFV
ncbi:MAG: Dyp-type peroxidase [Rhodospirillales bacterium]|nr:Dyp-type peroxidase [Rhodospirillales bacterium]